MYLHLALNQNSTYQQPVKFKKLTLFFLASSTLVGSGFVLAGLKDWWLLSLLIYCNLTGVFLVYRLNDCIDQDAGLSLNLKHFFKPHLHRIVVAQFVLILIPLAFILLSSFSVYVLIIAALLGTAYSLTITVNQTAFRIKNVFLLKNVLIGLVWGSLVLIGANSIFMEDIFALFLFTSVQVMIGSMIRDVPDLTKDLEHHVKSFPVVFGIKNTILIMHFFNLASLLTYLFFDSEIWLFGLLAIVLWRTINLVLLAKSPQNKQWSQSMNLYTCILIFIVTLVIYYGGAN